MKTHPDRPAAARLRGVLLAAGLGLSSTAAWSLELKDLMGWLAQRREGTATFTEARTVKGFDGPLESSGELSFAAPDRFVRRTLKPVRESMSVQGNEVTLTRGGRSRTMPLDAAPEAVAVVEAVRGTLTGNTALLQQHFRITLTGAPEAWVLDLGPREEALQRQVSDVQIRGRRGDVQVVEVWLAGGDRSRMVITPTPTPTPAASPGASAP